MDKTISTSALAQYYIFMMNRIRYYRYSDKLAKAVHKRI